MARSVVVVEKAIVVSRLMEFARLNPKLAEEHRFILWRINSENNRKPPVRPDNYELQHGEISSWTMSSLSFAIEAFKNAPSTIVGVGIVRGKPPGCTMNLVGTDFDEVVGDDHKVRFSGLAELIDAGAVYTEYSPSRKGIHALVIGSAEEVSKQWRTDEAYSVEHNMNNYYTLTGDKVNVGVVVKAEDWYEKLRHYCPERNSASVSGERSNESRRERREHRPRGQSAVQEALDLIDNADEGSWHNSMLSAVGKLTALGYTEDEIVEMCRETIDRGHPTATPEQLEKKVRKFCEEAQRKRFGASDLFNEEDWNRVYGGGLVQDTDTKLLREMVDTFLARVFTGVMSPVDYNRWAENILMQQMNRDCGIIIGASTEPLFVRKGNDVDGFFLSRKVQLVEEFAYFPHVTVEVNDEGEYKRKVRPRVEAWLANPDRLSYRGIGFSPSDDLPLTHFNLWRGWKTEEVKPTKNIQTEYWPTPVPVAIEKFMRHTFRVVADSDMVKMKYVIGWLAQMIQEPGKKPRAYLNLTGKQGVGKSIWVDYVSRMVNPYYMKISSSKHATGDFNSMLSGKLLVFMDEAVSEKSAEYRNQLFTLVTESEITINRKFVDAITERSFHRVIMASNRPNAHLAEAHDRRTAILRCSDWLLKNKDAIVEFAEEMTSGKGPSHLFHFLMDGVEELSYDALINEDQSEAISHRLDDVTKFFKECARHRSIAGKQWMDDKLLYVSWTEVHNHFVSWSNKLGRSHLNRQLQSEEEFQSEYVHLMKNTEKHRDRRKLDILQTNNKAGGNKPVGRCDVVRPRLEIVEAVNTLYPNGEADWVVDDEVAPEVDAGTVI